MIADSIRQAIKAIEESRSLVSRMRARQPQVIWSLDSYYDETHAALVALRAELAPEIQEEQAQAKSAQELSRFFDEWEQVLPADAREALRLIAKKGGAA